jgi:hypothetical protein
MKVGDKLFVQYFRYPHVGEGRLETITKVGRKWVYLDSGYRFELEYVQNKMMYLDGGNYSSPGRVWLCEGDYVNHCKCQKLWQALRKGIDYSRDPGSGVSLKNLTDACRLLKIPVE